MTITVFHLKSVLGRRLGPLVGLADLDDAIRTALGYLGIATADPVTPADADLTTLAQADLTKLWDLAEWRGLQTMLNNLAADDLLRMGVTDSIEKVEARLRSRAERSREWVAKAYSIGLPELTTGIVTLAAEDSTSDEFGACR